MKALNIKNMKETIVNYSGEQTEFDKIWGGFYQMATLGFISRETWEKFYNQCAGWYVEEDGDEVYVRDSRNGDAIVWRYTSDAEYRA